MRFALACAVITVASCSTPAVEQPSYLRVVLVDLNPTLVTDAYVELLDQNSAVLASLCLKLEDSDATTSFDLSRAFDASTGKIVQILVNAEGPIEGDTEVESGNDFTCPAIVPAPIGIPQGIALGFCPHEARDLQFLVGATCDPACGPGATCSAGLSTNGSDCEPGECCPTTIAHACALLPSN